MTEHDPVQKYVIVSGKESMTTPKAALSVSLAVIRHGRDQEILARIMHLKDPTFEHVFVQTAYTIT